MLQAKLQNGTIIIPASLSTREKNELKAARPIFYCPTCQEEVILRSGEKVIAHFAHRSHSSCPSSAGGESAYHQQGKLLLYEWLTKQRLTVELEVYLSEIQQRPDFLLHLNGRKIVIEYQCSKISADEIIKRTAGYHNNDMHVIWILGEKRLKRVGKQTIKLDSFTKTCMHQFSHNYPSSLFYFCPFTSSLIKFQDLSFLRQNLAAGKFTIAPLETFNFSTLLSADYLPKTSFITAWKREKKTFRTKPRTKVFGREREWQQWLYLKKLHIESLPSIIHLPVDGSYLLHIPGWVWQSKLVFELIAPLKQGQTFTLNQCERLLLKDQQKTERFPLIRKHQNPIESYLKILTYFGFIERIAAYTFKKSKPITLHEDPQTAIIEDDNIVEQLFTTNATKIRAYSQGISVY